MSKLLFKRRCSKDKLQEIMAKFNFDYFLTLDPDIYLLDKLENLTVEYLEENIHHEYNLTEIYDLRRIKLFSAELQLEWKRNNGEYHIVLISHKEDIFDGLLGDFEEIDLTEDQNTRIYLWGELDYDEYQMGDVIWYEGEIPKLLNYPVDVSEIGRVKEGEQIRAFIEVKEYQVQDNQLNGKVERYTAVGAEKIS